MNSGRSGNFDGRISGILGAFNSVSRWEESVEALYQVGVTRK
jgi:hypothetical protein